MKTVLLLGSGLLPEAGLEVVDFPSLRTWHFLRAILAAGHNVCLLALDARETAGWHTCRFEGYSLEVKRVGPDEFNRADLPAAWLSQAKADVVVSAGPFAPARAASRMPPGVPVWIDLPGDMMAEAQLRASSSGDSSHIEHAHNVLARALVRGDAFSVISKSQRLGALGQLLLMGRFGREDLEWDPVHVIPVGVDPFWRRWASEMDGPDGSDRSNTVIWPGSFNTWSDEETFFLGCEQAMARCSELKVVVTGGPIVGHEEGACRRLESWVRKSNHSARWTLAGWIAYKDAALAARKARIGVSLDRPCLEPELGSRTRLLFGLAFGLRWITTPGCDLARELVREGWARAVSPRDPDGLATAIVEMMNEDFPDNAHLERRSKILDAYSGVRLASPLARWLQSPVVVPSTGRGPVARASERLVELEAAIAQIHNSPTWRILSRLHKGLESLTRWPFSG